MEPQRMLWTPQEHAEKENSHIKKYDLLKISEDNLQEQTHITMFRVKGYAKHEMCMKQNIG
jgi:hypothetical protein